MAAAPTHLQRDTQNRLLPLLAMTGQVFLTAMAISLGVAVVLIGVWQILS